MSPKVSVITGYYNREYSVRRTLESLRNQTFEDFEVIVFDDNSTDGTADAIADFLREAKDPRFKAFYNDTNLGFVTNMARHVAQTSSPYVAVQGSGDVSLPRRLELQSNLLDQRGEVGVVGSYYTNVLEEIGARHQQRPDANDATFETILNGKRAMGHGEVMFRRSVYDAAGGYRTAFLNSQDYDLWLRMIRLAKFATINENLYDRYVDLEGESFNPTKFQRQQRYKILAQQIALSDASAGNALVDELERNGAAALVPNSHPRLQKRLLRGALRALVIGAPQTAYPIAKALEDWRYRVVFRTAAVLLDGPLEKPSRAMVSRLLKMDRR